MNIKTAVKENYDLNITQRNFICDLYAIKMNAIDVEDVELTLLCECLIDNFSTSEKLDKNWHIIKVLKDALKDNDLVRAKIIPKIITFEVDENQVNCTTLVDDYSVVKDTVSHLNKAIQELSTLFPVGMYAPKSFTKSSSNTKKLNFK